MPFVPIPPPGQSGRQSHTAVVHLYAHSSVIIVNTMNEPI